MNPGAPRFRGGRAAVVTAVAGTVFIAAGAFWLSFTALADLARRSGVDAGQAWAWPLIVDGLIVVATVAVVALAGQHGAWYPWLLLAGGAGPRPRRGRPRSRRRAGYSSATGAGRGRIVPTPRPDRPIWPGAQSHCPRGLPAALRSLVVFPITSRTARRFAVVLAPTIR